MTRHSLRRAFFLLYLHQWMQAQASASYPSRKRKRHALPTASYWDHGGASTSTVIDLLKVEYSGRHPHARYLTETSEIPDKYGIRPNPHAPNNDDSTSTNTNQDDAPPEGAKQEFDIVTQFSRFDDDFVRENLSYQHQLYHNNNNNNNNQSSTYMPLRIRFITSPLEERRGESAYMDQQIDEILHEALFKAAEVWAHHLAVHPVSAPISLSENVCFGSFASVLEPTLVSDADMVIIVSAYNELLSPDGTVTPVCGQALAVGAACALDQYDRPVVGFINLCLRDGSEEETPKYLNDLVSRAYQEAHGFSQQQQYALHRAENDTNVPQQRVDPTAILVHEVAHTLGFDSYLFKFYRNATTGEPLTPRPFETTTVKCPNDGTVVDIFGLPSSKVLRLGQTGTHFEIVTPHVTQVVRNHFNCDSATGAPLENYESSCIGSHWDERLFLMDIMSPALMIRNNFVTPLTLALLEDTGWYQVNYQNASVPTFGLGAGCNFVERDCIVDDRVPAYAKDYFCDRPIRLRDNTDTIEMEEESGNFVKCDPSHEYWAMCDLWDTSTIPKELSFPLGPQVKAAYFNNDNLVLTFPEADRCPIALEFLGVDCTNENQDNFQARSSQGNAYLGEESGPSSRCINAFSDISTSRNRRVFRPACMHVECDVARRRVLLGTGSFQQVCEYDGQVLPIASSESDFLECPRLATICPHLFCPASCSGRGICDYNAQPYPSCQCFDPADNSDGCYANAVNFRAGQANEAMFNDSEEMSMEFSAGLSLPAGRSYDALHLLSVFVFLAIL